MFDVVAWTDYVFTITHTGHAYGNRAARKRIPPQGDLHALSVGRRALERVLVVGARPAEERLGRAAEADHVEGAADGQGAQEEPQRLRRLPDPRAVHAAAAVHDEEDLGSRRRARGGGVGGHDSHGAVDDFVEGRQVVAHLCFEHAQLPLVQPVPARGPLLGREVVTFQVHGRTGAALADHIRLLLGQLNFCKVWRMAPQLTPLQRREAAHGPCYRAFQRGLGCTRARARTVFQEGRRGLRRRRGWQLGEPACTSLDREEAAHFRIVWVALRVWSADQDRIRAL
mmetsp:Transcript_74723/g.200175  ORF Transcript_74723/g.200175 Transcript_74723/m.200175 type:complete len:284 (-) Transcript_74723:122-973(-)